MKILEEKMVLFEKMSLLFFLCISLFLLVILTLVVRYGYTQNIDTLVLKWITSFKTNSLDDFFKWITWAGSLWVLVPLTFFIMAVLYYFKHPMISVIFGVGFFTNKSISFTKVLLCGFCLTSSFKLIFT